MEFFAEIIIAFIIGLLFGAFAMFVFSPARKSRKELEDELLEQKTALEHYRKEVDAHFLQTAELVNKLTDSYRDVHQHLASGTEKLCSEEGRKQALARTRSLTEQPEPDNNPALANPPLDYAPAHRGTLSEHFGLREEKLSVDGPFSPIDIASPKKVAQEDVPTVLHPPRDYAEECQDQGCSPNTDESSPDNKER